MGLTDLTEQLTTGNEDERIFAVRQLRQHYLVESTQAFLKALEDNNDVVVTEAAQALVQLKYEDAIPAIRKAYAKAKGYCLRSHTQVEERLMTSLSLAIVRLHRNEQLVGILADEDRLQRSHAAWVLGERKVCSSIDALRSVTLHDPDELVRSTAAWALGQMKLKRH